MSKVEYVVIVGYATAGIAILRSVDGFGGAIGGSVLVGLAIGVSHLSGYFRSVREEL
jgi:hypothetical protein